MKKLRMLLMILALSVIMLAVGGFGYLQLPKFGALPAGERLARVMLSPNYRDGEFRNLDPVPPPSGNVLQGWARMMLTEKVRPRPEFPVPSVKTDLRALAPGLDLIVWMGHASYYMQSGGKRYLVDPVFSDHASPLPLVNKAFEGTALYGPGDMPPIDYLLLTHDHWDHVDYPTVMALKDKVGAVFVPLGVGAHLQRWGFGPDKVRELDWWDSVALDDNTVLHALPALHYSARLLTRNKTLWAAFALVSPGRKIYLSGDSGYGSHFKLAQAALGDFDFAVLDSGQYNEAWRWVHMMPEDTVRAAQDLKARAVMPVHTGRFSMAYHPWDEPFERMLAAAKDAGVDVGVHEVPPRQAGGPPPFALVMPLPGDVVPLNTTQSRVSRWWQQGLRAQ